MDRSAERLHNRTPPLGQLLICTGCCCGRTEKGFPGVPVARVKAGWKGGLNRSIQLTISGCLGPCHKANVAVLMTSEGVEWFGGLASDAPYVDLMEWASRCHSVRTVLQLPPSLNAHRFQWLATDAGDRRLSAARPVSVALAVESRNGTDLSTSASGVCAASGVACGTRVPENC
jgi:cobaltochelatase CobN